MPTKIKIYIILATVILGRATIGLGLLYQAELPFLPLSFDSFSRTMFAYRWNYWVDVWLPAPMLITGLVMRLAPLDWVYAPLVVNLTASSVSIVILYSLSYQLYNETTAALITILSITVWPWSIWLSISGLAESLFHLSVMMGLWGLLRWLETRKESYLALSVMALLLAEFTRYEAWSLGALVWGLVIYQTRPLTIKRFEMIGNLRPTFIATPLLLAPLLWLTLQFWFHGDPFYFSHFVQQQAGNPLPLIDRLILYPKEFITLAPALLLLSLIGLIQWQQHAATKTIGLTYLAIFLLWFLTIIGSVIAGNRPSHLPERVVIAPLLLLMPFSGYGLNYLIKRYGHIGTGLAILLLTIVIISQLQQLPHYPATLSPTLTQLIHGITRLQRAHFFAPTDQILMERRGWDYIPVQALTLQPDNVWVDSSPPSGLRVQNSPLILSQGQVTSTELQANQFKLVIAHSLTATHQLSQFMTPIATLDPYQIFIHPNDLSAFQAAHSAGETAW